MVQTTGVLSWDDLAGVHYNLHDTFTFFCISIIKLQTADVWYLQFAFNNNAVSDKYI